MKLFSAAIAAISLLPATQSIAAQDSGKELEQAYAKKLKAEFLQKAPWLTDFAAARAKAKSADQVLLAYFTRSYAP